MNILFIHTLVLALASHRIAAHERGDPDFSTASHRGECTGECRNACKCGRISGSAGGAHSIAGIVEGCELGDSLTTGIAGQAGRPIGRSLEMPAPENR
jgi:hypothetical protein